MKFSKERAWICTVIRKIEQHERFIYPAAFPGKNTKIFSLKRAFFCPFSRSYLFIRVSILGKGSPKGASHASDKDMLRVKRTDRGVCLCLQEARSEFGKREIRNGNNCINTLFFAYTLTIYSIRPEHWN